MKSQTVTISDAARMIPFSRKTLYKHINQGKVSVKRLECGSRGINISELIRVYGSGLKSLEEVGKAGNSSKEVTSGDNSKKLDLLLKKIDSLESEVNRLNETVENLNNRLEYKPVPTDVVEPPAPIKPNNEISSLMAKIKAKQAVAGSKK